MNTQAAKSLCKIKDLEELAIVLEAERAQGKKIIHCHGVFDLLHIGHIRHFQQASSMGEVLVVTLTPDHYVNKGPSRPVFGQDLRAQAVAALNCVDYVSVNKWQLAEETIRLLRPYRYVKGPDYQDASEDRTGGIVLEEAAVKSVGGELAFTDDITYSASHLINRHMPVFSKEVAGYLADYTSRHSISETVGYLERASALKVLVVGETIIDEYIYCDALGKSGKEPVLAARYINAEKFAGGTVAVANHVSALSDQVTLLTFLGGGDSQEEFIRAKVNDSIEGVYLYMEGDSPTIVKRRFISNYPFQSLFELYLMNDDDSKPGESSSLCDKLSGIVADYDVVVVTDYGHGMLSPDAVEILCDKARFLAVNTQVNAGNRGFNTVSKYRRADFICVSESEIRLEARSRQRDIRDIVAEVSANMFCDNILITQGQQGCLCYRKDEGYFEVPALASRVVDRIGAGDAVFSMAALCVAQQAPMEIVGVIGNVAGAEAVATMGHQNSIQRVPFIRHVESLLK